MPAQQLGPHYLGVQPNTGQDPAAKVITGPTPSLPHPHPGMPPRKFTMLATRTHTAGWQCSVGQALTMKALYGALDSDVDSMAVRPVVSQIELSPY